MSRRVIAYQLGIFIIQWGLMILGFGILTRIVAPLKLVPSSVEFATYLGAGVKAIVALGLSVVWLFVWDRQVRYYFYKHRRSDPHSSTLDDRLVRDLMTVTHSNLSRESRVPSNDSLGPS